MGLLSKFENKMEDGIEGAAGAIGRSSLSPVQITKKAEKQMRREKMVGAGKQYAPTLYTVLVSPDDDSKLFKYYPTLAGETETYLTAKAREMGLVMDGQPLVRFLSDPQLKKGKFEVVAEMVAATIVDQLRDDEMRRYGLPTGSGRKGAGVPAQRERNLQPHLQPLQNLQQEDPYEDSFELHEPSPYARQPQGQMPQAQQYQQPYVQQGSPVQYQQPQPQATQYQPMQPQPKAAQYQPMQAQPSQWQAQPVDRRPLSAEDMQVPSMLGSQSYEVPQASRAPRGVSTEWEPLDDYAPRGAHSRPLNQQAGSAGVNQQPGSAGVNPQQLASDMQRVQQVQNAGVLNGQSGSPVVVMPALLQDFDASGARGAAASAGAGAGMAGVAAAQGAVHGSGVDAVFGEGSARTVDFNGNQNSMQLESHVYLYDEARDRAYVLTGDTQHIGRESSNDIVVPDINISRVHAEIHMQPNGQWVISDLGSTNGLFVNGQRVQSIALRDADMISLGTSTLEFQLLD